MGRRLILDTNIIIAYERGTLDRSTLDEDELAIASVTVTEYRTGIKLADTPERTAARSPRTPKPASATCLASRPSTPDDGPRTRQNFHRRRRRMARQAPGQPTGSNARIGLAP